jgi:hypothetical protein
VHRLHPHEELELYPADSGSAATKNVSFLSMQARGLYMDY